MVDAGTPRDRVRERCSRGARRKYLERLAVGATAALAGCGFGTSGAEPTVPKLALRDADAGDRFGASVALDGDVALLGAPGADGPASRDAGTAHVFARTEDGWSRQATLTAGDGGAGDRFGASVALSGNRALVGAWGEKRPNGELAGAAYVFARSSGTWTREAKLAPADGGFLDKFGVSVALDGGHALIGSKDDDPNDDAGGAAYVYEV